MRIGFAGLGAIGRPMAVHLARAYELTVWNRSSERGTRFAAEHGARAADTPRDLAAASEIVLTCLPTSAEVEHLLEGPDGLLAGLSPGDLLVDCTSGDPASSRRIARRLAASGVAFVDAPVSGGTNGAEAGTLTVMVGGDAQDFARALPVLSAFGKRIVHMGPVGTGHAMKAVNNGLLAVNILATGEGLAALVKAGIPASKAVEVLNASSGRSFVSEFLIPERVLTGTWPNTFRLALLEKDAGIAASVLQGAGLSGPVLRLAYELYRAARQRLGDEADYLEAIRLIEIESGVEIRHDEG